MPSYTFRCFSSAHDEGKHGNTVFVQFIQHREGKQINQYRCECGAIARRDLVEDLKTVNVNGCTPIHPSDSKFSVGKEIEFGFGKFKENPDGTKDQNHAPFRDTGELKKFMDGGNTLGDPIFKDDGQPLRRRDGSIVRKGAKFFKYSANATPSKDGVRKERPSVPNAWVDESKTVGGRGGLRKI